MHTQHQSGLSLVEVVIGVAMVATILVVVTQLISLYLITVKSTQDTLVASYQTEATIEAVRFVRDNDWTTFTSLPTDTALYLERATGSVAFVSTNPTPDAAYQTELYVRSVYRDVISHDLRSSTDSGTYLDSEARLIEAHTDKDGESILSHQMVFTNLFEL